VVTGVTAGSTTIRYTVSNSCGTAFSSMAFSVTPAPVVCTAPVADFTINNPTQCLTGNSFTFTNSSTGTTPSYTWNFGDGSGTVSTTNASHAYASANTYTVSLTATNACGINTITKTVTVNDVPAQPAAITGSNSVTAGNSTSLNNSTPSGVWSSDNTAVATVSNTGVVTGVTAGSTTIRYTVSNSCGTAFSSMAFSVTPAPVVCSAPVADFTINNPTQCLTGNAFTFTNSSTGTSPTYTWNFGDGSTSTNSTNANYSYTTANTYTVTLLATNACGSNQITKTVTVNTVPPTPSGISGANTVAAGNSTPYSSATTGGVYTSNNPNVVTVNSNGVVTGISAGVATITYTVSNACGSANTSQDITVTPAVVVPPAPVPCNLNAGFSINNTKQCVTDNSFVFTNTTTGGTAPYSYLWDLNDGTSATSMDVTKTYATYGEHGVTLKVTDANGCISHAAAQQLYVGAKPKASFSILNNTGNGQSKTFISSSTIALGNMTYLWDLGNGSSSTLVNPSSNYAPGNYTIQLIVSGIGTCKDTAVQTITELVVSSVSVYPNPVMDAVQVSFRSASATATTIKIMDLLGRVLQVQTVTPMSAGANVTARFDTRNILSGSYIIYISDAQNGFLGTKQILKQ
jgi:PKD repeat protein